MTTTAIYQRRATDRDFLYFHTPVLWPEHPFLPLVRRPNPNDEDETEVGLLYDARDARAAWAARTPGGGLSAARGGREKHAPREKKKRGRGLRGARGSFLAGQKKALGHPPLRLQGSDRRARAGDLLLEVLHFAL